jgi:integrase
MLSIIVDKKRVKLSIMVDSHARNTHLESAENSKEYTILTKIRFHDLRHSCATLLRHEGVPMEDIQKWLGHSEITTTEGIYAHFDDTQNVKTLAKISGALDGKPSQGEMK